VICYTTPEGKVLVRSRLFTIVWLMLALNGLGFLPGCGADQRPDLILIIMDTTRYDRLGCSGHQSATTPNLDSLAAHGIRFAETVSATPVTGPAITTILSSVLPPAHGVRDNRRFALNPGLGLLAEAFQQAGYQTGAVVAAVPLLAKFGYARGFEFYDDRFAEDPYQTYDPLLAEKAADLRSSERRADTVTRRALRWLSSTQRRQPVLLLVHYFDPHYPHDPPPAHAARHPRDAYDGEIAFMDAEIGRLLGGARDIRGGEREIRVVAVADHGEGLDQHEESGHGFFVYDSTVRVPLIFCGAGVVTGQTVTAPVRTLEIAPTICAWCDVEPLTTFSGRNLLPVLGGEPVPTGCDTAYVETFWTQLHYNWSPLQGIRTVDWKWIKAPRSELYHLRADPDETTNLHARNPERVAMLASKLEAVLGDATRRSGQLGASLTDVDPDLERRLEALGYVSGEGNSSLTPDYSLIDPKEGNRRWNRQQAVRMHLGLASRAYREGRLEDALQEIERASGIRDLVGREAAFHAHLLGQSGRLHEATAVYHRALSSASNRAGAAQTRHDLIETYIALQQKSAAAAHLDTLRSLPDLPDELQANLADLARQIEALR
jgi:arylsulfatase A-like enzyme